MGNKISLAMSGGVKVLNPTPGDVRNRVENLADIEFDPTYYVGYSPILEISSGDRFFVKSGSAQAGWVFGSDSGNSGDKTFIWEQTTSQELWTINHGLDKRPSVLILDSAGTEVIGHVSYLSDTTITITFSSAFKGKAILN